MGFSPINNSNSGNTVKSIIVSKSFNEGTTELLRNILGGPSPYDYKSQDGDTLFLSASCKKQLSKENLLALAQKIQDAKTKKSSE